MREIPPPIAKIAEAFLKVEGKGIVNPCLHTPVFQELLKTVALREPGHELIVNMPWWVFR